MNTPKPEPTREQVELLEFIIQHVEEKGFQPSRQEMANHFGISVPAIQGRLEGLEARGFILAGSEARAIQIAGVVFSSEFHDGKFAKNFRQFQERREQEERLARMEKKMKGNDDDK